MNSTETWDGDVPILDCLTASPIGRERETYWSWRSAQGSNSVCGHLPICETRRIWRELSCVCFELSERLSNVVLLRISRMGAEISF